MKLNDILEDIDDYKIPEYDEGALTDALMSDKPEFNMKDVFGEAFYPKIERWLKEKLKNIKVPKEGQNYMGGELRYKLDQYLQKEDVSENEFKNNAKILTREILQAIESWSKKIIKDQELPKPTLSSN